MYREYFSPNFDINVCCSCLKDRNNINNTTARKVVLI